MSKAYQEAVLRGKERTFGQFIWDGEKQAFLGRTFCSWVKIIIFYNIYYGFLAGFFSLFMFLFYQTLDTHHLPKYYPGNGDSLLNNPGLGFRPMPRPWELEQNVIWYNADHPEDIQHWVYELGDFMHSYEDVGYSSDIRNCNDDSQINPHNGEVCRFDSEMLGSNCNKENDWGYAARSPCVIIKMNKMIGWVPDVYENVWELPEHMPHDLKEHIIQAAADNDDIIPPMVWLSCTQDKVGGEILDDIGEIKYSPWRGFPKYYFPYMNIPGYMPPIVAIEFTAPPLNRRIDVRCMAWARNINHNRKDNLGMIRFSLIINTNI